METKSKEVDIISIEYSKIGHVKTKFEKYDIT
jgi:hypothetical protein